MTGELNPIVASNETLAGQVQARIREAIISRTLAPGMRIDQTQLAKDLNVSLVPVREALKGLEAEGMVRIIPRRGAFVTKVSREHLDDLYFARQIIEGEAIYHAVPNLTPDNFDQLYALIERMKTSTDAHDINQFMRYNRKFHNIIYDSLNNHHLSEVINSLLDRSELYRYRYMFVIRNTDRVHNEHLAIVDACKKRDPDSAKRWAIEHIRNTQQGLHRELAQELDRDES